MDAYESKLQAQITQCGERLAQIKSEIAGLVVRQEALRDALAMYAENKPRRTVRKRASASRSGSKFGFILSAIGDSGARGLTPSEMFEKAKAAGVDIKRNTMRSQLWQSKGKGVLENVDGRYRLASQTAGNGARSNGHHEPDKTEAPGKGHSPDASFESGKLPLNY